MAQDTEQSTELAVREEQQGGALRSVVWGGHLTTYGEAWAFAKLICSSDMVPKDYKGKPENAMVAMVMGQEIGLAPLQALQNIANINGRPAVWGDAILALVKRHPQYEWAEGDWDEKTQTYTCTLKRKGEEEHTETFSEADAKTAGLMSKDTYRQHLKAMCRRRATARCASFVFPDSLKGLVVAEEVQDVIEADSLPQAEVAEQRLAQLPPAPAKPLAPEPVPPTPPKVVLPDQGEVRLEELRARYKELAGKSAHPRSGIPKLESDIAELEMLAAQEPPEETRETVVPEVVDGGEAEPSGDETLDWGDEEGAVEEPPPDPETFRHQLNAAYKSRVITKEQGLDANRQYGKADEAERRILKNWLDGRVAETAGEP